VLDVDLERERVSLSLKATQEDPWRQFARQHYVGEFITGKVTKLVPFGAFVKVAEGIEGLVHISELAEAHVELPEQVVKVNDTITVRIIDIDDIRRRISLSLKQAVKAGYGEEPELEEQATTSSSTPPPAQAPAPSSTMGAALEDALRQRGGGGEDDRDSGGLSLTDVIADLQQQTGSRPEEDEDADGDE
jgi:small subunit ribosomal protein S1